MGYRRGGSWLSLGVPTLLGLAGVMWPGAAGPPTRALQARPAGTVAALGGSATDSTSPTPTSTSATSPPAPAFTTAAASAPATAAAGPVVAPAVAPTVPGTGSVDGMSCASASFCMAVGSLEGGPGGTEALIDAWDGTGWTALQGPIVDGDSWNSLSGVSCLSSSFCVAVGDGQGGPGGTEAVTELWNGARWTAQRPAVVEGGRWNSLSAVTCSSPSSCSATGTYQSSGGTAPLTERWDGTNWAVASPTG